MRKNVIFDFGNVLVRWQPEAVYNEHFGDEARTWWFMRHVATAEWRLRIDAGEPQDALVAELQAEQPEYRDAIALYRDRWREMLTGEMPGMREVLRDLKSKGYEIFGLTNWSMETFPEAREHFEILQMIDRYVVSGAEGLVKPDRRLFQRLLDRYGLRADECIFVDDNEANVQSARAMGMEGIVFKGADDLREQMGLYRNLTDDEIARLIKQDNWANDWADVFVAGGCDLGAIHRNHFGHEVYIGNHCTIEKSTIEHCAIGDGCTISDVRLLSGYSIGSGCRIELAGEVSFAPGAHADIMNENGGRRIGLHPDMTVGNAYLWARYRDRKRLMHRFETWSNDTEGRIGSGTVIHGATAVIDGIMGPNCEISHGVIAERFLLGENVRLEAGLRLNDTVVGDNSTLARGEVGCSLIFPAHEQHHNSSFLIAALTMGQSNIASGATIGSNHNGRTADGELQAGRGFWPGLCVSLKHNCRFASYTLLAKGDYPAEMNITLPFALVNNNTTKNRLEVMPAYWWMYNMYALERNRTKFAARDRRTQKRQHIEFAPLAPDTAEEIIVARELLHMWTAKAYQNDGSTEVVAYGMERGHRKTVILKPGEAYKAYEEMLIHYAMEQLNETNGEWRQGSGPHKRERRWMNVGGQLIAGADMDRLLDDIEHGELASWNDVGRRLDDLWAAYPQQKSQHAYDVLCELAQKNELDAADWACFRSRHAQIKQLIRDRIAESRQKDADNEFRQTTFLNTAEMAAVMN